MLTSLLPCFLFVPYLLLRPRLLTCCLLVAHPARAAFHLVCHDDVGIYSKMFIGGLNWETTEG